MPNLRACQAACAAGAEVDGQNAFPSAEVDLLGAVDFLFSRGMDHHTLMTGSSVLNKLANKVVRQLSGLGKLPDRAATDLPEVAVRKVDVCVIGGGPAGLAAAAATARAGRSTILIDDQLRPGGSLRTDPRTGRRAAEAGWADATSAGVEVLARSTAIGYFPEDGGGVLAVSSPERLYRVHARVVDLGDRRLPGEPAVPRQRPARRARRARGRPAARRSRHPRRRQGLRSSRSPRSRATRRRSPRRSTRPAPRSCGSRWPTRPARAAAAGCRRSTRSSGKVDCDLVAVAGIPAPASEGPRQQGCKVVLDPVAGGFRVLVDEHGRTSTPGVWACGDVTGYLGPAAAAEHGARVGMNVAMATMAVDW